MEKFISKEHMIKYFEDCSKAISFDKEKLILLTEHILKHFNNKPFDENINKQYFDIMDRWYASCDTNPDYSVYSDIEYLCESWVCWKMYSRNSVLVAKKHKFNDGIIASDESIKSVYDLGCGTGLTTSLLTQVFPDADVYGTNFEDSYQYKIAQNYGQQYGFIMEPAVSRKVDLIFASEYFEHIYAPIEHLQEVLDITSPKYAIIANSFNTKAIGHFNYYQFGDKILPAKQMSKLFSTHMIANGYELLAPKCWNNRPQVWRKK